MAPKGYLSFVLHFHLPWVLNHGKWPHGEDWLNEAAVECYLPLLQIFTRLSEKGVGDFVTIGLTPILVEQLSSDAFKKAFPTYVNLKIEAAEKDMAQFEKEGRVEMVVLAKTWLEFFVGLKNYYLNDLNSDIIGAFKKLQDKGAIEIITCAATHGYLPLLSEDNAIKGQVTLGVENYKRRFDVAPRGIWLPECAYRPFKHEFDPNGGATFRPGIEKFLKDAGIHYTIVDTHMIKRSASHGPSLWPPQIPIQGASGDPFRKLAGNGLPAPIPRRGALPPFDNGRSVYRAYEMVGSDAGSEHGVCIFLRDPRTSMQVWSGQWGYPGDGRYLEFHKKHWPGGHRYWRVTDSKADLGDKQVYDSGWAGDAIRAHADHFAALVKETLKHAVKESGEAPIIVCPFDAELFGHWWFEGPRWLESVLTHFSADAEVNPTTLEHYLNRFPPAERVSLPEGSWGDGGDFRVWLNQDTTWTWEKVYEIERRNKALITSLKSGDEDARRVAAQLLREQVLLEASDWQFLITTGTARDYSEMRLHNHYSDSIKLGDMLKALNAGGKLNDADRAELSEIEKRDSCFELVNSDWWK